MPCYDGRTEDDFKGQDFNSLKKYFKKKYYNEGYGRDFKQFDTPQEMCASLKRESPQFLSENMAAYGWLIEHIFDDIENNKTRDVPHVLRSFKDLECLQYHIINPDCYKNWREMLDEAMK